MLKVPEKSKERSFFAWTLQHPGITFWVVVLVIFFLKHLNDTNVIKNLEVYKPPVFKDLKVSTGTMILQPFERNSGRGSFITDGYYLRLKLEDQSHLTLKCYLINFREAPCYRERLNMEPSFKSDLAFQKVTVRWLPLNDREKFHGIVYQIEKDNVPLIYFDSFVERYKTDYEKVTGNKHLGVESKR